MKPIFVAVSLTGIFFAAAASAAELRVLATGAMGEPLKTIARDFEKRTGQHVDVSVGITTTVTATLDAGDTPDVIEVTTIGMNALDAKLYLRPNARREVAHAVIGLAVKAGAPAADISTPKSL